MGKLVGRKVLAGFLVALFAMATWPGSDIGYVSGPVAGQIPGLGAAAAASRRICKDGHFHYGESAWRAKKAQAEAEALEDWSGFTAFEYGTAWGNFNAGQARSKSCEKSGDGLAWKCSVQAIPCMGPAAKPIQVRAGSAGRQSAPKKRAVKRAGKSAQKNKDWSLW